MRSSILLLALAATILGGCASAYKTGQTPDDVYFSPARQQDDYVNVKDQNDDQYNNNDDQYYGDEYLRMRVHNRAVWSELDDPYFYNPAYSYGYSYSNSWYWNNPWNPYTYWNCSYNPYYNSYYPIIIGGSKTSFAYNHPRVFNLNTYNPNLVTRTGNTSYLHGMNNGGYNNYNSGYNRPVRIGASNSNSNVNSNTGNFLRNVFNNSSNNSSNSSNSNSGRSSSGSSSSSSGSSGSSGGSAPVRRF